MRDTLLLICLVLVSGLLLFNNLGLRTISLYDEAINSKYDIAIDKSSDSVFFPEKQLAKRYYRKFPLKTAMKIPIFKVLGFSTFSLRFLDALMGLLTVVLVFLLARRFFDVWTGFAAGFILTTTDAIFSNWSRHNQYDSGYIFGSVLFIYFFVRFYKSRFGWIWCSLPLAFTIYFKHILSFVTLAIVLFYLLLKSRWWEIFSIRFIGMCSLALGLLLLWAVPFQMKYPSFFRIFLKDEWSKRVFEAYFGNASDYLFYIKSLKLMGASVYLLAPAILFAVYKVIKKRNLELSFLLIWTAFPLGLLTLAGSKLERYYYISYPALAILTAYMIVYTVRWLQARYRDHGYKVYVISCVILFPVFIYQGAHYFIFTSKVARTLPHIVSNYYRGDGAGRMIIHSLNEPDFLWPEYVHYYCADRRGEVKGKLSATLKEMEAEDTVIVSRKKYLNNLLRGDLKGLPMEDYAVFDYSPQYRFISSPVKVKVGIIKAGSRVMAYLNQKGTQTYRMAEPISLIDSTEESDTVFTQDAARRMLGYELPEHSEEYFTSLLAGGSVTREGLARYFENHARTYGYHYRMFVKKDGFDRYIRETHLYELLERAGMMSEVTVAGMNAGNFEPYILADLYESRGKWDWVRDMDRSQPEKMREIIVRLKPGRLLIVRREDFLLFIDSDIFNIGKFRYLLYADFCTLPEDSRESKNYPSKFIVGRASTTLLKILKRNNIKFHRLNAQ